MIAALALLAGLVLPAHAAVEFAGYLQMGKEMKFLLTDPATGKRSDWLARGGRFDGYTVINFDAKKELLIVEKAGTDTALSLKQPGTQMPTLDIQPSRTAGSKTELTLRLARAKADQVELAKRYREAHPAMIAVQSQIAEIEKELARLLP